MPEEFLVEHLLLLALAEALFAALGDPVAARVGSVDLVDDPEFPLGMGSKFILGIDENEAALPCPRLAGGEEVERHPCHRVPLLLGQGPARHELLGRDGLVVLADGFLGAGSEDRLVQLFVLAQSLGEVDPVSLRASARLMVAPQRSGQVPAHHHLHRERRELAHDEDARVGDVEDVVGRDVLRLVEPEDGQAVEQLAFERHGREHPVEGAQAIGGDHHDPIAFGEVVAHLAAVERTEPGEVGLAQGERELRLKQFIAWHCQPSGAAQDS